MTLSDAFGSPSVSFRHGRRLFVGVGLLVAAAAGAPIYMNTHTAFTPLRLEHSNFIHAIYMCNVCAFIPSASHLLWRTVQVMSGVGAQAEVAVQAQDREVVGRCSIHDETNCICTSLWFGPRCQARLCDHCGQGTNFATLHIPLHTPTVYPAPAPQPRLLTRSVTHPYVPRP